MKTKKLTLSGLLIALGVITGNLIFIPVGGAKCFPVQHIINVLAAVILGPGYALCVAFSISLLRNILGVGTILAFPGSMIGAFLAGIIYKKTKKNILAVLGEVFGTGILGGWVACLMAKLIMGKSVGALYFIPPFLISTVGGSLIAYLLLKALEASKVLNIVGFRGEIK
ncbi:energy coupling factor transporter S component ThiW [Clostridium cavendishii DSM 21758]|uniref:Energy coupling factor transporter S component ThiW n=1 Tax=Clostridium cavendishii DSM 21758 TaxID=1121302 RepID=A0A1M6EEF7_9CLOT|nr:energy coupling factor transporter S component ThiW [Clostridium cavendishii]SHI83854.1 energy coupling factor transporter S component ThiW [Clostridium cavendishii DSM 21758]